MNRRQARELALKTIYSFSENKNDFSDFENILNILRYIIEDEKINNKEIIDFAELLVKKVNDNVRDIDNLIEKKSKNWKLNRISNIDKSLLRLSIAEMLYLEGIPVKVTINEAIELAKQYSSKDSYRFINGILDSIKK